MYIAWFWYFMLHLLLINSTLNWQKTECISAWPSLTPGNSVPCHPPQKHRSILRGRPAALSSHSSPACCLDTSAHTRMLRPPAPSRDVIWSLWHLKPTGIKKKKKKPSSNSIQNKSLLEENSLLCKNKIHTTILSLLYFFPNHFCKCTFHFTPVLAFKCLILLQQMYVAFTFISSKWFEWSLKQ